MVTYVRRSIEPKIIRWQLDATVSIIESKNTYIHKMILGMTLTRVKTIAFVLIILAIIVFTLSKNSETQNLQEIYFALHFSKN